MEKRLIEIIKYFKFYLDNRVIRLVVVTVSFLTIREFSKKFDGFSEGPIVCPIRLFVGVPCPACGTTRAIGSIAIGDYERAWSLNPLGYLIYLLIILWVLSPKFVSKVNQKINSRLGMISLSYQISSAFCLYAGLWLITLVRTNNGIV
jgi:hypothetical protein